MVIHINAANRKYYQDYPEKRKRKTIKRKNIENYIMLTKNINLNIGLNILKISLA